MREVLEYRKHPNITTQETWKFLLPLSRLHWKLIALLSNPNSSDLLTFTVILESQGQICNYVLMKDFLCPVTGKKRAGH